MEFTRVEDNSIQEKEHYRYIYVDSLNQVHILVPLSRGSEIGLDNTCRFNYEIREFFGCSGAINPHTQKRPVSAVDAVTQYIADLRSDLRHLDPSNPAYQGKQERLLQLHRYQTILRTVSYRNIEDFPVPIHRALEEPGANCAGMQFKPSRLDSQLKITSPRFKLSREYGWLGEALNRAEFQRNPDLLARISTQHTDSIKNDKDIERLEKTANDVCAQVLQQVGCEINVEDLRLLHIWNKKLQERITLNWMYGITLDSQGTTYPPNQIFENVKNSSIGIENGLNDVMLKLVHASPFEFAESENISILIQFFIGVAALYCDEKIGQRLDIRSLLDLHADNRATFVSEIQRAFRDGISIENCILKLMQRFLLGENHPSFNFNDPLVQQAITQRFRDQAFEIMQGEAPHWDEFIQLWTEKEGGHFYGFEDQGKGGNGYPLIGLHLGRFVFHHSPSLYQTYFGGSLPKLAARIVPMVGQHPVKLYAKTTDSDKALVLQGDLDKKVVAGFQDDWGKKFFARFFNPSIWTGVLLTVLGAGLLINGISIYFPLVAALSVLQVIAVTVLPLLGLVATIGIGVFFFRAIRAFVDLARHEVPLENTWVFFSKKRKIGIIMGGVFAAGLLGAGVAIGIALFALPLTSPLWQVLAPVAQVIGKFFATGLHGLELGGLANLFADGYIATAVLFITVALMLSIMIFERCLSTTLLKEPEEILSQSHNRIDLKCTVSSFSFLHDEPPLNEFSDESSDESSGDIQMQQAFGQDNFNEQRREYYFDRTFGLFGQDDSSKEYDEDDDPGSDTPYQGDLYRQPVEDYEPLAFGMLFQSGLSPQSGGMGDDYRQEQILFR